MVHVRHQRVLHQRAGAVGRLLHANVAGAPVEDPERVLVGVDHLEGPVALEVEHRRSGLGAGVVAHLARPADRPVGLEDGVVGLARDPHLLGGAVLVEVGDRAVAVDSPGVPEVGTIAPVGRVAGEDLELAVAIQVDGKGEGVGAADAVCADAEHLAGVVEDVTAQDHLGEAVPVEVGDRGSPVAAADLPGGPLERAVGLDADHGDGLAGGADVRRAVSLEIADGDLGGGVGVEAARGAGRPEGAGAVTGDGHQRAVGRVRAAGEGVEDDVRDVIAVDVAVAVVVGEVPDRGRRHHVVVAGVDGVRGPLPLHLGREGPDDGLGDALVVGSEAGLRGRHEVVAARQRRVAVGRLRHFVLALQAVLGTRHGEGSTRDEPTHRPSGASIPAT